MECELYGASAEFSPSFLRTALYMIMCPGKGGVGKMSRLILGILFIRCLHFFARSSLFLSLSSLSVLNSKDTWRDYLEYFGPHSKISMYLFVVRPDLDRNIRRKQCVSVIWFPLLLPKYVRPREPL